MKSWITTTISKLPSLVNRYERGENLYNLLVKVIISKDNGTQGF